MEALGHGAHDQVLHLVPPVDDLGVADANHVIPEQAQRRIVRDVLLALSPDVVSAVNLQHEPVPDQEVDAVSRDPDLPPQRKAQPQ